MRRSILAVVIAGMAMITCSHVQAGYMLYGNYTAWAADAGAGQKTINFEGLSNIDADCYDIGNVPNGYGDFTSGGLTTGGVHFSSPSNGIYTVNPRVHSHSPMPTPGGYDYGTGDVLNIQSGSNGPTSAKQLTATPVSGQFYAFGAWVSTIWENGGVNNVTLSIPGGGSISLTTLAETLTTHWDYDSQGRLIGTQQRYDPSQMIFIGIISDTPFNSATLSTQSGVSQMNVDNVVYVGTPEPVTLSLLAVGSLVLLGRRFARR